jgi:hypothetical protein
MPPQQRVRRGDRRDFAQGRAAEPIRAAGQPPAIVVRETDATAATLTAQEPILFDQVRDRLALTTVEPASELNTICSAAGSITRRSLYHSCVKKRRSGCGTVRPGLGWEQDETGDIDRFVVRPLTIRQPVSPP